MQIVVWVAVAVFATSAGPDQVVSSPFKTQVACEAFVAKMDKVADDHPELLALGQSCVQVTVTSRDEQKSDAPKMSIPKPNALGDTGVRGL